MKNRLIINLFLAVLLIALGFFTWFKSNQKINDNPTLSGLDIQAIHSIKIHRAKDDIIELQQTAGEWKLLHPMNASALPGKVERLLKISQIKPPVVYPLEKASLDLFGLQNPLVTLSFNDHVFKIGQVETIQSRRYVSNDAQLFLLEDTFVHHLTAPANTYINTRLLPNGIQITGIETPEMTLHRQKDHTWRNTLNSDHDALSSDAVQMLLDEWRFARAIQVNIQSNQIGEDQVIIHFNDHQKMAFYLLKQKEQVILISAENKLAYTFSDIKYKKMTTLPALEAPDA